MTYEQFKKKYNGKYLDFDGSYGNQCWDLAQYYFTECLGLPKSVLSGCGLVSNMLYPPKREQLDKYFYEVDTGHMKPGDVCIWEYGHIAIFDNWDGKYCYYFSQNYPLGSPCHIQKITEGGLHAFRIKNGLSYQAHVQDIGDQAWKHDGETAGTTGKRLRLEGIRIDFDGDVYAKAHIQHRGWKDYGKITKDTLIGTKGEGLALECLCLKGDFKYRVHLADFGWTTWTKADSISTLGSVGQGIPIEAIQIKKLG